MHNFKGLFNLQIKISWYKDIFIWKWTNPLIQREIIPLNE